jgi:hypothetical protein
MISRMPESVKKVTCLDEVVTSRAHTVLSNGEADEEGEEK